MRRRSVALAALVAVVAVALAFAVGCSGGGDDSDDVSAPFTLATTTTSTGVAASTAPPTTLADAASATTAPPTTPAPAHRGLVVVDPGHNGGNGDHPEIINQPVDAGGFAKACNTTGASTNDGVTESAINWAVAQLLRDRLEVAGFDVIMTRDSDDGVGPYIDQRGLMAADAHVDVLVSIHADGAGRGDHGFHVIHPALRRGYTDATVEPSTDLAVGVRDALVGAGLAPSTYAGTNGLDERDDLGTLNRAGVPAVMLEAGNLRNRDDAALLTSTDGQSRVADALASAITAFVG